MPNGRTVKPANSRRADLQFDLDSVTVPAMGKCHPFRVAGRVILASLVSAFTLHGAQDAGLILSSPAVSSNGFTFALNAESGVSYIIQASSNLLDWVAVATNTDPGITRAVTITNPPDGASYYRAARAPLPRFGFALAANQTISFSGTGVVDGFDSANPIYSSNGLYAPALRKDNASVVSNSRLTNAVQINSSEIYGRVATGPGGTVTTGVAGAVGDITWIGAGNFGIEAGHDSDDINVAFPDVAAPFAYNSGIVPLSGTILGTNYTLYVSTGNYSMSTLSLHGSQNMAVIGNAVLYVNGSVSLTDSSYIYIAPGASLTMYVNGTTATISGYGVANTPGVAAQFAYYGLSSNTTFTYSGSNPLIGTIYAPHAAVTVSGPADWSGGGVANSINITGGASFHYDESLARSGPTR
jgi:hypothetical protein